MAKKLAAVVGFDVQGGAGRQAQELAADLALGQKAHGFAGTDTLTLHDAGERVAALDGVGPPVAPAVPGW